MSDPGLGVAVSFVVGAVAAVGAADAVDVADTGGGCEGTGGGRVA